MAENIELARLAELLTLDVMDTAAEPEFDRLTALAAKLLRTPIALLSFFDGRRQWFKSCVGITATDLPLEQSMCWTMADGPNPQPVVVLDMLLDDRFREYPIVAKMPNARFYAGVPLTTSTGVCVGALCAIDVAPRNDVAAEDIESLRLLADLAASVLHTRQQTALQLAVTRRALLADRMMADVAQAESCVAALEGASRTLAEHFGAPVRQIWRRRMAACTIKRIDLPPGTEHLRTAERPSSLVETALTTSDIISVPIGPRCETAGLGTTGFDIQGLGTEDGETAGLCRLALLPVAVGEQRFALVFGFDQDHADLADMPFFATLRTMLETSLERKAVEERLRLLNSSLDMANDGVAITELDPTYGGGLRLIYVNKRLCELTGQTAAELIGFPPRMLDAPGSEAVQQELQRAMKLGFSLPAMTVMHRTSGTAPQVETESAALRDPTGRVTHVVSIHRDVTRRLREERKQREAAKSFRLLFESNPLPMWVFDKRTYRFLMVNDAAVSFYGWSREEFLQMTLRSIRPVSEWNEMERAVDEGFRGHPGTRLFTHRKADGTIVRMGAAVRRHTVLDENAMLSALWDMTAVQAAREELAYSNSLLSDLAEQLEARTQELTDAHRLAKLATWRLSPDRKTMTWSDEIYNLIGRSREEYPPSLQNALDVFHPDDQATFQDRMATATSGEVAHRLDARMIRADSRIRHVKIDYHVARDGSLAGYIQDWSEQWDTEQALMRSEKLAILGQVTGGVAHDFNNLLTVITLNLEESIEELPEGDELQTILVPALHASRRCAELTNQLLAYARQAPLRPQAISLETFFATCRPMIRRALSKQHDLVLEVSNGQAAPLVDASQLQTALVNLALNARDAMPNGGELRVMASTTTLPSQDYDLEDVVPGNYAVITMADSGHGIPSDITTRIFEPFFTTKGDTGNSGLGLSMVDGFVRQSGGYTQVRSVPAEGTTIRLFLPLAVVEQSKEEPARTRPRVLVVDDQPAVLATVTRMLNQLGYDVSAVTNAASALAELDRDRNFSVLFTDIILPGGMDGFALSKIVRSRAPHIQILLTSGYSEKDLSQSGIPGVDILAKPYKRKDLLTRLTALTA